MKTRDLELLSAYLDGALPPEQLQHIERRIQDDPQLRAELEALEQTRALLRQMPRRRAPRNFMLSPRQVAKHPPMPRFYPLLQWSTALTVALLAVSLGLQLVLSPVAARESMPAMRAMSAEESTEVPLSSLAAETLTPMPEAAQPGILSLPTSTPEIVQPGIMALPQETPGVGGGGESGEAGIQPGITALHQETPVSKAPSASTAAPLPEAEEAPPAKVPSTLERPVSPLPLIAKALALLIALELLFLLFLRWWSARRWRNWS